VADPAAAEPPAFEAKFATRAELDAAARRLPRPIVLTNGVFDILHRGHVTYLAQARALGASLVVALNDDASARALAKAPDRPINLEDDRVAVVAALESVSLVTLFAETIPLPVVEIVRPDVYVKGGDYDIEMVPEAQLARRLGARVCTIPLLAGRSTTGLIARLISGLAAGPAAGSRAT
jgi:D-glycero-beta-D-manno-heptose 1-phosphate adenylyltransferase